VARLAFTGKIVSAHNSDTPKPANKKKLNEGKNLNFIVKNDLLSNYRQK
jgi:hypothetical protein